MGVRPPDPQLAVGPNHIFEMVNTRGSVFSKAGSTVGYFTLGALFQVSPGLARL